MRANEGVGLAANQVGRSVQAFVLECETNRRYPGVGRIAFAAYVNPRIVEHSHKEEEDWEGCLSIPGYRGRVPRAREVTFEALTAAGEPVHKTVSGFHARIIQHEVDHINGLFYIDRMKDLKSWFHLDEFNKKFDTNVEDKA